MLWLLSLHITALLVWAAALFYLVILLIGVDGKPFIPSDSLRHFDSLERFVYTQVASPAALAAIVAGSLVFWVNNTVTFWLVAKLTVVTLLAATHAAMGLLVLRRERETLAGLRSIGYLLALWVSVLLGIILWLVLAKPSPPGGWPWL